MLKKVFKSTYIFQYIMFPCKNAQILQKKVNSTYAPDVTFKMRKN